MIPFFFNYLHEVSNRNLEGHLFGGSVLIIVTIPLYLLPSTAFIIFNVAAIFTSDSVTYMTAAMSRLVNTVQMYSSFSLAPLLLIQIHSSYRLKDMCIVWYLCPSFSKM